MTPREEIRKLIGPTVESYTEAQLEEAEANLREYVALALRVFERLALDPEANMQNGGSLASGLRIPKLSELPTQS
jgi:hypothetical protein